jgi:hemerythrin-like domain-containing protein
MLDICDYLEHYPDRFHHPREDVAFAQLALRDPSLAERVDRLKHEHRIIAWVGKQFTALLEGCIDGSLVGRADVEACASMYLVYYRQHLNEEEREILPAAEKLLTAQDWAEVAAALPDGRDPLFGDEFLDRFRELRRRIDVRVGTARYN